jgi:hypothetical protein
MTAVLTPVTEEGYWRVKIAWPNSTPRFFGRFDTQTEAEKWITDHRWMAEQRQDTEMTAPGKSQ